MLFQTYTSRVDPWIKGAPSLGSGTSYPLLHDKRVVVLLLSCSLLCVRGNRRTSPLLCRTSSIGKQKYSHFPPLGIHLMSVRQCVGSSYLHTLLHRVPLDLGCATPRMQRSIQSMYVQVADCTPCSARWCSLRHRSLVVPLLALWLFFPFFSLFFFLSFIVSLPPATPINPHPPPRIIIKFFCFAGVRGQGYDQRQLHGPPRRLGRPHGDRRRHLQLRAARLHPHPQPRRGRGPRRGPGHGPRRR